MKKPCPDCRGTLQATTKAKLALVEANHAPTCPRPPRTKEKPR